MKKRKIILTVIVISLFLFPVVPVRGRTYDLYIHARTGVFALPIVGTTNPGAGFLGETTISPTRVDTLGGVLSSIFFAPGGAWTKKQSYVPPTSVTAKTAFFFVMTTLQSRGTPFVANSAVLKLDNLTEYLANATVMVHGVPSGEYRATIALIVEGGSNPLGQWTGNVTLP